MVNQLQPTILAIETSSTQCSVALSHAGKNTSRAQLALRDHTDFVLKMIESLLTQAGVELHELDAVAYSCGPGSFTGLRITTAITQGIAYAHSLPVIPISSLQTLAQVAHEKFACDHTLVSVDARNQSIYWGAYQIDEDGVMQAVVQDSVANPADVMPPFAANWVAVGDGWSAYHKMYSTALMQQCHFLFAALLGHAVAMLPLAVKAFQQQRWQSAENAAPIYCRDDIVQTTSKAVL